MKKTLLLTMAVAMMCTTTASAQQKMKTLSTNGMALDVTQLENSDQTVLLTRYLFAGYNTICLPVTLSAQQLARTGSGLKVERLSGIAQQGNTLSLYFTECTDQGIEAGMPYLIYSPKAQYMRVRNTEATAVSTTLQTVRMTDGEGNQVAFSSSWNGRQRTGQYGIPAKQNVSVLESVLTRTSGQTFLPTRCAISWEQQAPTAVNIDIKHAQAPANTTAIKELSQKQGTFDVYDLNGRLMLQQVTAAQAKSQLGRGVYVVGGEKVIVK